MNIIDRLKKTVLYNTPSDQHPIVIDECFLSMEEINDIKLKVFDLKQFWQYLGQKTEIENNLDVMLLPLGKYTRNNKDYSIDVKTLKHIMFENFSTFYNRIKEEIEKIHECEVNFLPYSHYPGFHIFHNSKNYICHYPFYRFHKDRFFFDSLHLGKIYSYTVPILLPSLPTGLAYCTNNLQSPTNKNSLEKEHLTFYYKVGSLIRWNGNLLHSIKPFHLIPNESRITLQFHVSIGYDQNFLFW